MKPKGQQQMKVPMVLTQNLQLCYLEVHSSRAVAQTVPADSGQGLMKAGGGGGLPRGKLLEMVPGATQQGGQDGRGCAQGGAGGQGRAPQGMRGREGGTSPLQVLLSSSSRYPRGEGTQEAALHVSADKGTRRGGLATLSTSRGDSSTRGIRQIFLGTAGLGPPSQT